MEDQPTGRVLYRNPDYKPETKEPYNVRLTPTVKGQIQNLAKSLDKSEADVIAMALHVLIMDRPTIEQRAQEIRTVLTGRANELYWSYQNAEKMPQAEFELYNWIMEADRQLDRFIPQSPDL